MSGFIKLSRKFLRWEWYSDITVSRVFLHCLFRANYKSQKWQGITIERGSFVTSLQNLADESFCSVKQVRRALNLLQDCNAISIKRASKFSIVSVINYSTYQDVDETEGKQREYGRASRGNTEGQAEGKQREYQRATIKEREERKEDKEDKLSHYACVREGLNFLDDDIDDDNEVWNDLETDILTVNNSTNFVSELDEIEDEVLTEVFGSPSHPPDENETDMDVSKPTIPTARSSLPTIGSYRPPENFSKDEVMNKAQKLGMTEEQAEKFFLHYDKQGWVTNAGVRIVNLQSAITSWMINDRISKNSFNKSQHGKSSSSNGSVGIGKVSDFSKLKNGFQKP